MMNTSHVVSHFIVTPAPASPSRLTYLIDHWKSARAVMKSLPPPCALLPPAAAPFAGLFSLLSSSCCVLLYDSICSLACSSVSLTRSPTATGLPHTGSSCDCSMKRTYAEYKAGIFELGQM